MPNRQKSTVKMTEAQNLIKKIFNLDNEKIFAKLKS